MPLNKVKKGSQMYDWITHTLNYIKGECSSHLCNYCYAKRPQQIAGKVKLDEKEFKTKLGNGNFIFIGSSTDMFAKNIPSEWIERILNHLVITYPNNKYLFQTKNPERYSEIIYELGFLDDVILGTTIETNRDELLSKYTKAPDILSRYEGMTLVSARKFKTMVTIEPIMDFDTEQMVTIIEHINPKWVNIGADSGNNNLIEPDRDKVLKLIERLEKFTKVKVKSNLKRLIN